VNVRRGILTVAAVAAVALAGCGGQNGGGGGGDGADNPTEASVAAGDEVVAHPLAPGRYRLTIRDDCDTWAVMITQDGGDFVYEKANSPVRVFFVNDVPGGNFFIEQTDESCTEWSLALVRVSAGN
jgi:hypothetical protein